MRKPKSPRELAARALCRKEGHPEDIQFEGAPMWQSYLPEVDTVLEAIGWIEPCEVETMTLSRPGSIAVEQVPVPSPSETLKVFNSPSDYPPEDATLEVLHNGKWLRARFRGSDSYLAGDDGQEEIWWMNHFMIMNPSDDDPLFLPEDIQSGGPLPQWRLIQP